MSNILFFPHKLIIGFTKKNKPKFHKMTFYAADPDTMGILLTLADCPEGEVVLSDQRLSERTIFSAN